MVSVLAHFELAFLCVLTLCLALLETPVPRVWALAGALLVTAQTAALTTMRETPVSPGAERADALVGSVAEGVAALGVPALSAVFLVVVSWHCARAYARARRRLEAGQARRAAGMPSP